MNTAYETVIGIEVHVQLQTKTKIFCSCPNAQSDEPNRHICPVCAGHPGVLPVLNEQVVKYAIMAGIATNCTVNQESEFARKHYFYPDLPKNYQITQNEYPICSDGLITIWLEDGTEKQVRLIRIHIEEDAGKNVHAPASNESFVDLNRAGTPLLEIVSHPDIRSIPEAKAYLKALRNIVTYLGICSGNMEEGAFRADTNVSVRKKGETKLGTRCELKNINSFKFIGDAVEYEVARQIEILEAGGTIKQETRSWNVKEGITESLRGKEEAADYRYFPDPDLPKLKLDAVTIADVKKQMPELPDAKFSRITKDYGLSSYEAEILINDPELSAYYEQAAQTSKSKQLINWVLREVITLSKDQKTALDKLKVTPIKLAYIVNMLDQNIINSRSAKEVFEIISVSGGEPEIIVKEKGLEQMGSSDELEAIIKDIVASNPSQAAEYKAGRDKLWGFFVGQAMAKTKGKGNPQIINDLLKKYLS